MNKIIVYLSYSVVLQSLYDNVVGSTLQPSKSLPVAANFPSGQQPNKVSLQDIRGQFSKLGPWEGETSSGQQPYLVSLHVGTTGQPVKQKVLYSVTWFLKA